MKRLMILTVILMIAVSALTVFSFAEGNTVKDLGGETQSNPLNLASAEDSSIAAQFVIESPVISIEICCPTWSREAGGYLTMSLYRFDTDYSTTVEKSPIKEVRYDGFDDNQWLSLTFEENAPLEPGEYIVMLDEPEVGQMCGVWLDKNCDQQLCYSDGVYDPANSIRSKVTFLGEPEKFFGTPTPPKAETDDASEHSDEPYMDLTVIFNDPDWIYIVTPVLYTSTEIDEDYLSIEVGFNSDDPQIEIKFDDITNEEGVYVKDYPVMMMKVRRGSDSDPLSGEIFFYTEKSPSAKAGNNFYFYYEDTTDWQYVIIDLKSNAKCRDYFTGMRFDVFDHAPEGGNLDIEWITFFQTVEAAEKFDGDFSKYIPATPEPTQRPATPEPTEQQAADNTGEGAATPIPSGQAEPTGNSGDNDSSGSGETKDVNKKFNAVPVIVAAAALAVVFAVVLIIVRRRKKG